MLNFWDYTMESKVEKLPDGVTAVTYGKALLRFGTKIDQVERALKNAMFEGKPRFSNDQIQNALPFLKKVADQRKATKLIPRVSLVK